MPSRVSGPPWREGNSGHRSGWSLDSRIQTRSTATLWRLSGATRSFRPLPIARTCGPVPRWGQREQLGDAQTGLHGGEQQRVIAASGPGRAVGAVEQRVDLRGREEGDGALLGPFRGDREHPLDLRGVLGVAQRAVVKERVDRGEADVAGARAVSALVLEVFQERADRGRVELCELQAGRRRAGLLLHEAQQQPERVAVAGDGVRADPALAEQPVGEVRLQRRGEGGHDGPLSAGSSRRAARPEQLGRRGQVVVGAGRVDVAHVGRQRRQAGLHVGAGRVPVQQRAHRKAVPDVMHARPTARRARLKADRADEASEHAVNA